MKYLFDTSAILAHYRTEPGHEIVGQLLAEHVNDVFVSALTWFEFRVRLKELTPNAAERAEALSIYAEILAGPLPVTGEIARAAFELRERTASRLPNSDALIAATAKLHNAALVHCDHHMSAISERLVRQIVLPDKTMPAAKH